MTMSEDEVGDEDRSAPRREVAAYVADMAAQLASMARDARLPLVAHLLEVTQLAAAETTAAPLIDRRRGAG